MKIFDTTSQHLGRVMRDNNKIRKRTRLVIENLQIKRKN